MAEVTEISWCDHTLNFWIGCQRVSPACDHCYAETWAERWPAYRGMWNTERRHRVSPATVRQVFKWNCAAQVAGERRRVFVNSLSDFFDNEVEPVWRAEAWAIMKQCDWLDFMLLTKRGPNIPKMLPLSGWPWPNIWLGITAEDQHHYNINIHHLCSVPAARRFISHEPALGPIDYGSLWLPHLDLIIFGGESGSEARPAHPNWARHDRDQCADYGVAFHLKQWGEWAPYDRGRIDSRKLATPGSTDEPMQRFGKRAAGRLLDGRTWSEMPS